MRSQGEIDVPVHRFIQTVDRNPHLRDVDVEAAKN